MLAAGERLSSHPERNRRKRGLGREDANALHRRDGGAAGCQRSAD